MSILPGNCLFHPPIITLTLVSSLSRGWPASWLRAATRTADRGKCAREDSASCNWAKLLSFDYYFHIFIAKVTPLMTIHWWPDKIITLKYSDSTKSPRCLIVKIRMHFSLLFRSQATTCIILLAILKRAQKINCNQPSPLPLLPPAARGRPVPRRTRRPPGRPSSYHAPEYFIVFVF